MDGSALRRLMANSDFKWFLNEFVERQRQDATETALSSSDPHVIFRAQGAERALSEITSICDKAGKSAY